jgi:hypothetical protein
MCGAAAFYRDQAAARAILELGCHAGTASHSRSTPVMLIHGICQGTICLHRNLKSSRVGEENEDRVNRS